MRRVLLPLTIAAVALVLGSGVAWAATIVGTNRADKERGTTGADKMYGLNGNDRLHGLGGRDEVSGGAGVDILHGGKGNDVLWGGTRNDTLKTGLGSNEAYGGPGPDIIRAAGTDTAAGGDEEIYAGSGDDIIYADDGAYDRIDCGEFKRPGDSTPDHDIAIVDEEGDRTRDCETIDSR